MNSVSNIAKKVINGEPMLLIDALDLEVVNFYELLFWANRIREKFKGNEIRLCGIINAKSGMCSEDCTFCAQSASHRTAAPVYPYVGGKAIVEGFKNASENGASCFGVVSSGNDFSNEDLEDLCKTAADIKGQNAVLSASIGKLSKDILIKLKDAGINKIHHNLETSRSYFPSVCSTHSYDDRIETIRLAKNAGFEVCSGGLFGIGEKFKDRVELALLLSELNVDSVPLNFLNPVPGTPLENSESLPAQEILRTIALFRFVLPEQDISVCGGREVNLGDLQSWIFMAGASGMMIGNYLTTAGRDIQKDLRMISDLGLEIY
jgi:biotin synthase